MESPLKSLSLERIVLHENAPNDDMEIACKKGNMQTVKLLIEKDIMFTYGDLRCACESGNVQLVEYMFTFPDMSNINKYIYWRNIYHSACCSGNVDMVHMITKKLDTFVQKDEIIQECSTDCFLYACSRGFMEMILLLVEIMEKNNIDTNLINRGLLVACENDRLNVVKFLMKKGANDIYTGLTRSYYNGGIDIFKFMYKLCLEYHRKIENRYVFKFNSAIEKVLKSCILDIQRLDIVSFLGNNSDDDSCNNFRKCFSTIHQFNISHHIPYIKQLLYCGLKVEKINCIDGYFALILELNNFKVEVTNTLHDILIKELIGIVNEYAII